MTRRYSVKGVNRRGPIAVVGPGDFLCAPGVEIDATTVLRDPAFSLFCVDLQNDAAVFVESSDPDAVERAPFYYQAQVETAIAAVTMPLDLFHRIGDELPDRSDSLIFVHSVGRCGSTLVSKALQAVPSVYSLSEPDDLTQVTDLWVNGEVSSDWVRQFLASSIKWRGAARTGSPSEFIAVKPRSEVMVIADLLASTFPTAKHSFLYRDGLSWMRTIFRGWAPERDMYDIEQNRKSQEGWSKTLPLVRENIREDRVMNPVQVRMYAWITGMEGYLRLIDAGVATCAVRFEDLQANAASILEQFFEFCGVRDVDWAAIQEVLGRDSQAGTTYSREARQEQRRELTDALVADVRDVVADRPLLRSTSVLLPGTLSLR